MLEMNVERVPKIILMGFVSYATPWIHFFRHSDEHILYVIKSGELHMKENGIEYVLKRGDMLLLEPGMDHEGTRKATCDYYYFHFLHPGLKATAKEIDPSELARSYVLEEAAEPGEEPLHYLPKHCSITDKTSFHQLMHAMNELLLLYRRKHYNRGLTALRFSEFLIELSRDYLLNVLRNEGGKGSKAISKVHALLDYIEQHYTGKITSELIEREFESNYDYLNRVFKEHTGETIMRYVNKIRIQHAQELIRATHMSFGEIGYLTGLEDPYYFSKVFKQYVGLSPMQYYKKVRES
ncbi:AraC family transcriptional regulator [Paenibacillus sp. LHD-117]|uniref:AraC family transcriptional regulator n=1 Tax=Paenibacillus sp. LHD-117 TaxID=3071412 RepID=UPI0027E037F5|nr:AraC family transcriptional regulator [Paenibacillus sp. LHD-117]MDQ6419793.1 AraC family transcriptional regulator [Paenibacillus sp. LHD-117]